MMKTFKHVICIPTHPLDGVQDDGHALDGVGVDDGLEHEPLLQAEVGLVDQPNLLQHRALSRLGGA